MPRPKRPPQAPPPPAKSAQKTAPAVKRVLGRPFPKGKRDPRQGRGPKKGAPNAGRPRLEHVAWCQAQVSDPKCEKAVALVLRNPKHPAFSTMWRAVTDRGYGKAAQPITDAEGGNLPPIIQLRFIDPEDT